MLSYSGLNIKLFIKCETSNLNLWSRLVIEITNELSGAELSRHIKACEHSEPVSPKKTECMNIDYFFLIFSLFQFGEFLVNFLTKNHLFLFSKRTHLIFWTSFLRLFNVKYSDCQWYTRSSNWFIQSTWTNILYSWSHRLKSTCI